MGNGNKEQVFFIMAERNQWGVYDSSVISFVLNTFINSRETQTSVGWQNLQRHKMFSLFKSKKDYEDIQKFLINWVNG